MFRPDGTFVKEAFLARRTTRVGIGVGRRVLEGSRSSDISTSPTASTTASTSCSATRCELLTSFGDGGRQPGQFYGVHSIAVDSKGNIYTTETWEGKRVQKFVFKGVERVPRQQGVVWPRTTTR